MPFPDEDLDVQILAYLGADPTADPGTWPSPTDLSSRLLDKPVTTTTGRRQNQKTAAAGSCVFYLDNDDGALTPLLATSTYYPHWDLGVPVAVDVDNVGASPPYGVFRGYVADVTAEIIPTVGGGSTSAVKVTLGGIIRRLGQGAVAKSPLRRTVTGRNTAALDYYWAMEDGFGATLFGSGVGGTAIPITDTEHVLPGFDSEIVGSLPLATIECFDNGSIFGQTGTQYTIVPLSGLGSAGFAIGFVFRATLTQSTHLQLLRFAMSGATGLDSVVVNIYASTTSGALNNNFGAGVVLVSGSSAVDFAGYDSTTASPLDYPNPFDGQPHAIVATVTQNGADIDLEFTIDDVPMFTSTGSTLTLGTPTDVNLPRSFLTVSFGGGADSGDNRGSAVTMGHLAIGSAVASNLYDAMLAFAGEEAAVRIARVCAEEGIPHTSWSPAPDDDPQLGPQPVGDILEVLRDSETVGHGILYETLDTWGVGYRPLEARYNLSASLTIDLATYRTTEGTSRDVLLPIRNDARIRNEWTIRRPDGSEATVLDAAHQARHGRYNDSATVNVATDEDLIHEGGWRVREGTLTLLLYAKVPTDLGANAAAPSDLLTDWLNLLLGDRIDRIAHPSQHPTDVVSLVVEGYTSTMRHRRAWTVDLVAEPYEPYHIQQLAETPPDDDLLDGWLIPDVFALRAAVDDDDTSWVVDCWPRMTTDADDMPCRITVGGEAAEITAVATTAATYVALGTEDHDDNAAVTPGDYAGGAVADWVCVVAGERDTGAMTLAISDANYTYTLMAQRGGLYFWAAVRTASTPAPTITPTGGAAGDTVSAIVFGLRGMPITGDLTQYVLATAGQSNASAQNIAYGHVPAGGYAGRVILLLGRKSDDWTSTAAPSGFTTIGDPDTLSGDDQGLYLARRIDTTPTEVAYGSIVVTGGGSAVSDSLVIALQGGFQTVTVTRSENGVVKSHAAGAEIELLDPLILSL